MTEPKEIKWLKEYSNGRRELKENALKNGSLPDFASFDLEFWKKIYEEGKQAGATEATKDLQEELEFYRSYNAEKKEYNFFGFKKVIWIIKAKKILKDIIAWAEWKGPGCPNFDNIKKNVEKILNE